MPFKDQSVSSLYRVWHGMIRRCFWPQDKERAKYGGRGITVCEEWRDFKNFVKDMSPRPAGKQIDRIDNNGHYCKENCRWVFPFENCANTRQNKRLTMFGETLHQNEWCRRLVINQTVIRRVLKSHPDPQTAISNYLRTRKGPSRNPPRIGALPAQGDWDQSRLSDAN